MRFYLKQVPYFSLPADKLTDVIAPSCYRYSLSGNLSTLFDLSVFSLDNVNNVISFLLVTNLHIHGLHLQNSDFIFSSLLCVRVFFCIAVALTIQMV